MVTAEVPADGLARLGSVQLPVGKRLSGWHDDTPGFHGTVNRYGTPELLSAVLRSWEERFDAVLVEVGFEHIRLLARRLPRTLPDAQAVAAELWPMCDEFWPLTGPARRSVRSVRSRSASRRSPSGPCGWTSPGRTAVAAGGLLRQGARLAHVVRLHRRSGWCNSH